MMPLSVSNSQPPEYYMALALRLAERGLYTTDPNPRVGCVVVRDGAVIGEGWHRRAGEPHAEVHALAQAGAQARGATLYVTLEPCSHFGRTPPCAKAVIEAGVARVVAAMEDPNPLVAGKGLQLIRDAGIEVQVGVLESQAQALNIGFVSRMQRQRPWVRCKLAMSLDGRTAMTSGESQWITGADARRDVQRLRARSSAILTGIGTVLKDDPSLTVRPDQLGDASVQDGELRQPLRVVLDRQLQTPPAAKLLTLPGRNLIAHGDCSHARQQALKAAGAELYPLVANTAQQLPSLLGDLASQGCNELLVEAGPRLSGALLQAGLVDELWIYMAAKLMGHQANPLLELHGLTQMSQAMALRLQDVRAVGQDLRLVYQPVQPA